MQLELAVKALEDCESRLRDLVAVAAAAGDYEAVIQLTDWARGVASMRVNPGSRRSVSNGNASVNGRSSARRSRRKHKARRGVDTRRAKYPKFARHKEDLVKIGWSKKERTEYQHKAPRQVIDALIAQVMLIGSATDLFTTDDIFPLSGNDGSFVPSYQAYLALAWLRAIGFLNQHGRQGYSLAATMPKPAIDKEWANLPKA
jgi:hypothetical protein